MLCFGKAGLCLVELVRGCSFIGGPDCRQGWWGWRGVCSVMGWDEIKWAG